MKQVLSLLLAFVFLQAETWAIGGGPASSGGLANLVGSYAGVLIPRTQTNPPVGVATNSASIGLFGVNVPNTGLSSGAALAFVNGVAFIGDVTGIVDPKKQTLLGVVTGISNFNVISINPVTGATVTTAIFAQGSIKAKFQSAGLLTDSITGANTGNHRLKGVAALDLFGTIGANGLPVISNTVTFAVDGFQQSATTSTFTITLRGRGTGN